jgi:Peptidase A4 family
MLRRRPVLLAALVLSASTALATGGTTAMADAGTSAVTPSALNIAGVPNVAGSSDEAGYVDTAGTYTSVSASWTQPAGTCSTGDQYAAFWVGIDGYTSSTVEQTGTEVDCVGKTAEYYAWYQLYPGASDDYSNTVKPGDHFTATVTWLGGEKFSLYIDDSTQGWSHTTDASLGATPARSSAEVVVAVPCCTASGGNLALTDFGSITFTDATANGESIGTPSLDPIEVTMPGVTCTPIDGESFTCTWGRSN